MTRTILLPVALTVSLAIAAQASAKTIHVAPGPGTPLQGAIDAAAPGDALRLETGVYPEAVVVTKRLRIYGYNSTVDAQCGAAAALTIAADDVRVERFTVVGGTVAQVDVQDHDRVTLRRIRSAPSCAGVQYGISTSGATRLTVQDSSFRAFDEDDGTFAHCPPNPSARRFAAALRASATPVGGRVRLLANGTCGADVGILAEDTADAPSGPKPLSVERNVLHSDERGIVLRNSDGTLIRSNTVMSNGGETVGIEVEAGSDDNVLVQNKVQGYPTDVSDAGTSNCWRANTFTTGSVPATGCP